MKQTIIKTISFVLCGFILFGSSAVFPYAQDIDNTEISSYTESVNLYLSDSAIYLNKATPQSTNISAIIKTPFLIVLVRETPDFLGEVKTIFFIGTKVKIKETTGYYCLVETKSGTSGYVFKGWLDKEDDNTGSKNDGKYEFNRSYEHVYVDHTNADSAGNPRSKIKNSGDKTVTYSTNNTSIISVDSETGLITGKKAGTAKLIAKIGTEKVEIPVYCIYRWKKGWTGKTSKSTTIYSGTSSSTTAVTSIPSGTKFCVQGDDGGSAGWAYGYADIAGNNDPWGFVKIGNISTKGTVSQYNSLGWSYPIKNNIFKNISSPYGWRSESRHLGLDINRQGNTEINGKITVAPFNGTVVYTNTSYNPSTKKPDYGYCVVIESEHPDPVSGKKLRAVYMHFLERPLVDPEDPVIAGKTELGKIGSTGYSTGPHLHFEVNNCSKNFAGSNNSDSFDKTINPIFFFLDEGMSDGIASSNNEYWYNDNK